MNFRASHVTIYLLVSFQTFFTLKTLRLISMDIIMECYVAFSKECYEVLIQESPAVIIKIAELITTGCNPDQIKEIISTDVQNTRSAIPLLAWNAACYLSLSTPVQCNISVH